MKNQNETSERLVSITLSAVVAFYTGVSGDMVGHTSHEEKIPPGGGTNRKFYLFKKIISNQLQQ